MVRLLVGAPATARAAKTIRWSRIAACRSLQQRQVSCCSSPLPAATNSKIESTKKWFQRVVIGEKLCPFASPLLKQEGLLRIVSSSASNTREAIFDVQKEVHDLVGDTKATHETTLVVMDAFDSNNQSSSSFVKDYMDFVRLSWELQSEAVGETYQEKVQLVLFHPLATHQTYGIGESTSPADYTIRSPYPTIHLLREEDVLKAVQSGYPDLEYLPSRNKAKLVEQGLDACRNRLQKCYSDLASKEQP